MYCRPSSVTACGGDTFPGGEGKGLSGGNAALNPDKIFSIYDIAYDRRLFSLAFPFGEGVSRYAADG